MNGYATVLDAVTGRPIKEVRAPDKWGDISDFLRQRQIDRILEYLGKAQEFPHLIAAQTSPGYTVTSGTSAHNLAAATAETTWNLIAGSAVGVHVIEWGLSFDGVTASAVPVNVELCQGTQATTGTVGASPTPTQIRGRATTVGVTAGVAYTAEPTVLTPVKHWLITPNGGLIIMQYPLGREPETDLSAGPVKNIALRATAPATVNCRSYVEFERL